MTPEHERELKSIFQELYPPDLYFEIGDGWYDLVFGMSRTIQDDYVKRAGAEQPVCAQIKEKFGLLRVYFDNDDTTIRKIVDLYEELSRYVCEECGEAGKIRGGGWIEVRCDACESRRSH